METASWGGIRYVVIGVGINILPVQLSAPASGSPATMAVPPGCLQDLRPGVDAGSAAAHAAPAGAGRAGL